MRGGALGNHAVQYIQKGETLMRYLTGRQQKG